MTQSAFKPIRAILAFAALSAFCQHSSAASGWSLDLSQPGLRLSSSANLAELLHKARKLLNQRHGLDQSGKSETSFEPRQAIGDATSTTLRFTQSYKNVPVLGREAIVHFDRSGKIVATSGAPFAGTISTTPALSVEQARRILNDRYQQSVALSAAPALHVLKDFDEIPRLAYRLLTKTTLSHSGKEIYVDAHDGAIILEFERAYHASQSLRTVYSAATAEAQKPGRISLFTGFPTTIDTSWYDVVIKDGNYFAGVDRSALNAYRNSAKVYDYFKNTFDRRSYDDKDSRIVSVVHAGKNMNNAFWSDEEKLMAYGDGDGRRLLDTTYALDIAAHELTHGVTSHTAHLVYASEPGALNESFSDFFGKMVDYDETNWVLGARLVPKGAGVRGLRNMENPEEFRSPGNNASQLRWPTKGVTCTPANDQCGVHFNSGIPNRAAFLIVKALGKEKTEQLYYRVLTRHLSAMSNFLDMRLETEKACGLMYGENSSDCKAVTDAFDTVRM